MPVLVIQEPSRTARTVDLTRSVLTVGRGDEHDVALDDASVGTLVVALRGQGGIYEASVLEGTGLLVNGRRVTRQRLSPGDTLRFGQVEVRYLTEAPAVTTTPAPAPTTSTGPRVLSRPTVEAERPGTEDPVAALAGLQAFSARLLDAGDVSVLAQILVDQAIQVSRADKGFLALVDGERLVVPVARQMDRDGVQDAVARMSDGVVRRVLETRQALLVDDASADALWSSRESVVDLRLCSVLCTPLVSRGGAALGVLYLAHDRVAGRFGPRMVDWMQVYAAQAALLLQNTRAVTELLADNSRLRASAAAQRLSEVVASCDAMRDVLKRVDRVAPADVPVLITGETGTGKELIARRLHEQGARPTGPFVVVNCGAIPEALLESELFGHVRGAFTGAVSNRVGRFQAAHGGTLFLDEVGELPLSLQVKLLRVLQDRVVTRVGDNKGEAVDVRIVAATHRVLEDEVRKGTFREDLYYRLHVVGIHLPPLRDRGDDVLVLARHLVQRYAREQGMPGLQLGPDATDALRRYAWPGNVRQLENRIRKAVVLSDGPHITAADLDLRAEHLNPIVPMAQAVEDFKERYVDEVLARHGDNRSRAAKDLGVDARTVFRYLERKRARLEGRRPVDPPDDLDADG